MEFSFSHLVRNCSDAIKFQEVFVQFCCRSPHGERGLKSLAVPVLPPHSVCRSPHGERGLKSVQGRRFLSPLPSLPTRGAWIEIGAEAPAGPNDGRRSPHGERGLKSFADIRGTSAICRSPHGERGLKLPTGLIHSLPLSRSPHGERGLKSGLGLAQLYLLDVAPHTGSVD